ncbi:methyl-accepting chemotaxis protein [Vibrio sp. T187]|uniref:methyl-accepting chemotaxis protein n=1 Tax=Vibrio TaxID=662 RepID=UPI0010C95BD9|nr:MULTISPECIES: methyl-accepting chemotaxis protein [Vibrio]MBW3697286.1 methyl-accepting chemotaxis protein [Vibrio sp. T187]
MDIFGLRKLTIQKRLILLTTLITIMLLIPLLYVINQYQDDLMTAKKLKTRHLVESAHTLVNHFYQQQASGDLTSEQAQQQAKDAVEALRYETKDYFWINDMQPMVVMHPIKPALNGKDVSGVKDPTGKALFVEFVQVARADGQGFVSYMWPKPGSETDVEKISYIKLFKPWGWIIGTGVYVDDIEALVWDRIRLVIFTLVFSLAVMAMLAIWISRSISLPCKETLDALNDIASGEGDLTKQLSQKGNDELTQIATAFNQFTGKIRSIVLDMTPIGNNISSAAVELNNVAQDSSNKANQQHQAVDTVASAMNELHASNQEVANAAHNAATAAQEASEKGTQGTIVIDKASGQIDSLSALLSQTEENTNKLAQDSQNVGTVLDVIRGIAEQTNLLALNAAIEAARAGEQGRGFAVVADEVRTLATRTQASTDEIEQIVVSLQNRAKEVSDSMAQTQVQSSATQEQAELAKSALGAIEEQVNIILALNEQIAEASSQQTTATEEISQNLTHIADHSVQTTSQADQVAQASNNLLESGEQLQSNLSIFKV